MAENTQIVEYESNGEMVKISPTMIKRYLVSGNGNVSDGEVMMFMSLCRYQHLNPFLREAYLIKYGSNDPATIVTGKDVFTKRANADPRYKGKKAGIVVIKKDGTVESLIVPRLPEGSIVTVPRAAVHNLVTEYGTANFKGKSTWERTELLINVAHPDFREDLIKQAERMGIWCNTSKISY